MDDGIPQTIGRYRIDRLIGSGAMGFVFLGRDPELDRPVAIKTLRDLHMGAEAKETFMERFRNEARAAARLHHPHIVQVYDVGEDPAVGPYLVFEYVPGSTLKEIVRNRGPLPPGQTIRLADQVSDALDHAHAAGIIHRDIKPDNLLVTQEGKTKLADFGVARIPDAALTREGQFLGTPCYSAPETLASGRYGPESDLFSFAAVLYEVVSGTRAFPGDDAVAVAAKVMHDEPVPPSQVARGVKVPAAVDEVLMQGLSKNVGRRHRSARELTEALRGAYQSANLLDHSEALTLPAGAPPRPPPPAQGEHRSHPFAFGAVLIGALAVGIALVFAFSGGTFGDHAADAGVAEGGVDAATEPTAPPVLRPANDDAGPPTDSAVRVTSEDLDAGPGTTDAGPAVEDLTPHEREERAKDAIDRAEAAIEAEDWVAARQALDEAERWDPEDPDVDRLRAELP